MTEKALRLAGLWLYERVQTLMDAPEGSAEFGELDYLAGVVSAIEEHGVGPWPDGAQPKFPGAAATYRQTLQEIANAVRLTEDEWAGAPLMRFKALLRITSDKARAALEQGQ